MTTRHCLRDDPTPDQVAAQMSLYGPQPSDERWPSITLEVWLARRLGDRTLLDGLLTAEQRRERIRQRIISDGRQDEIVGRNQAGVDEDYATLFARAYGVPL